MRKEFSESRDKQREHGFSRVYRLTRTFESLANDETSSVNGRQICRISTPPDCSSGQLEVDDHRSIMMMRSMEQSLMSTFEFETLESKV